MMSSRKIRPVYAFFRVLTAVLLFSGCGREDEASGPTSVLLAVHNGAGVMVPDAVEILVYENGALAPLHMVTRLVTLGPDNFLGDIVVYAGPAVNTFNFVVNGIRGGAPISRADLQVPVTPNRQITRMVTLQPAIANDGGVTDGSVSDAVALADASGTPDSAMPTVDTAPPLPGTLGAACTSSQECDSGFCVDYVCCETDCQGECYSCRATPTTRGTCTPSSRGTACKAPPLCFVNNQSRWVLRLNECDGMGTCETKEAQCPNICVAANLRCE